MTVNCEHLRIPLGRRESRRMVAPAYHRGFRILRMAMTAGIVPVTIVAAAGDAARALLEFNSFDPVAVGRAIEHLAARWPDRYNAPVHRAALAAYLSRAADIRAALQAGDTAGIAEARRLAAGLRDALLANPLLDFDRVLILKRGFPKPEQARRAMNSAIGLPQNWQSNDSVKRRGVWNDELAVLSNLRGGGSISVLYRPEDGRTIVDPELDFDGERVLFAMEGTGGNWRLFEIRSTGGGLRQVTPDDGADVGHMDPCWLPDGRILFTSSAAYQGLPCVFGSTPMVCLYRLDPATGAIRQLTFEQDSNWCPAVMPDGRVLYQRWEYADLPHSNSRRLFTMNPDGTGQRAFYGSNGYFPNSFFYARPVPGHTSRVIGIAGGHHGTARSGRLLILDASLGQSEADGVVQEIPGFGRPVEPIVRDRLVDGVWPQFLMPYPLDESFHLVAAKPRPDALWGIYLVDVFDNMTLLAEVEGAALLEPIPLRATPRPPVIPDRVDERLDTATVLLRDVYSGPGLAGVPRGTVRSLRVVEYYFSVRGVGGLLGSLGMDGPWDARRVLGTVPVEPDGSAHFTIPANTPLTVQPLDERGQALQLMRSWIIGRPGEFVTCSGCHEMAAEAPTPSTVQAMRRPPSAIAPWHGPARGFSFAREVQPVLDRHCVPCHSSPEMAAAFETAGPGDRRPPYLAGDRVITNWSSQISGNAGKHGGRGFSLAYAELHRFVRRPGIESDMRLLSPQDYRFNSTELGQLLRSGHHGVRLSDAEWERFATWADMNAPFHAHWSDIVGPAAVTGNLARARELRRRYVPGGPFPIYEPSPSPDPLPPPAPALAARPAAPAPPQVAAIPPPPDEWPFDAAAAAARQSATAPPGSGGRRVMPLDDGATPRQPPCGRFLRVHAGPARWLSLAEVEVFSGGRNIAVGRAARQSSTSYGGEPRRAVDGNRNGAYASGSVTHTGSGPGEWWEVDLGVNAPIEAVVIWNRTDTAGDRLGGARVELLDAARTVVWYSVIRSSPGEVVDFRLVVLPVAIELAWIPPGHFMAGGGDAPFAVSPRPAHVARGFWMARHEISNAQFRRFNPAHDSRDESRHGYQFGRRGYDMNADDQPAVRVAWTEADAFCRWLSAKTGLRVRLPTETEWEWACRAGADTPFFFGPLDADYSRFANLGDRRLKEFAACTARENYSAAEVIANPSRYDDWVPRCDRFDDGAFVTCPIGSYAPNAWGLHDMHGNAWEWTSTPFEGAATAPPDRSVERIARGGSWYDRPFRCTAAARLPYPEHQRVFNVGFRIVVDEPFAVANADSRRSQAP